MMPAATAALSDSARPRMGSLTSASACARTSSEMPRALAADDEREALPHLRPLIEVRAVERRGDHRPAARAQGRERLAERLGGDGRQAEARAHGRALHLGAVRVGAVRAQQQAAQARRVRRAPDGAHVAGGPARRRAPPAFAARFAIRGGAGSSKAAHMPCGVFVSQTASSTPRVTSRASGKRAARGVCASASSARGTRPEERASLSIVSPSTRNSPVSLRALAFLSARSERRAGFSRW